MSNTLLINPSAMEAGLQAAFAARSQTSDAQAAAFDRFVKLGFPNRRVEGWKWSDFNAALRQRPVTPDAIDGITIAPSSFAALDPLEFRIINGRIEAPPESPPEGLRYGIIDPVATIPELETHAIAALNVAMTRKALGLEVSEGAALDRPILIRHINTGAGFTFAQTLTRIGSDARVDIIESYEGEGAGFYAHLYHMAVREGASVRRMVQQETGPNSIIHAICAAKADAGARFEQSSLSTGARLSRHETIVHVCGADASTIINSAALLAGERHADFTTHVFHKNESCKTRQLHKGVARDRGRIVFQGKFHVDRMAQKTDAKMTANALLLSDTAEANHKPELEIYADDVECAHGSTAGALNEDALFYLRQRGLDEAAARGLLVEAFLGEVIDGIEHDGVHEVFGARVQNWLGNA
jgi:Fe-S cluster assembly protein SufD